MSYTYAIVSDKEITAVLSTPYFYVECDHTVNDTTHYYNTDTSQIELKSELQYTLSKNGLEVTISGLPENLHVQTNNLFTMTDEEDLVIEYDIPGTYTIELSGRVEYLDTTINVEVSEAPAGEGANNGTT